MSYPKYFKPGQKVQLRPLSPAPDPARVEFLTAYLEHQGADTFVVRLPYGSKKEEQYPFETTMPLELSTDTLGIGVKMTVEVEKHPTPEKLHLKLRHDLQAYQRRHQPRTDAQVELRFSRSQGNLRTMRQMWAKNVQLLDTRKDFAGLGKFNACEVNLSFGGIRFAVKPPIQVADLCLLLIRLPDEPRPLCLLAEIVWAGKIPVEAPLVGMKFIAITEDDQERLELFVSDREGRKK